MLPQVGVPSCTPAVADTAKGWLRPLNFKETLPVFQESARGSQICWAQVRMLRGSSWSYRWTVKTYTANSHWSWSCPYLKFS